MLMLMPALTIEIQLLAASIKMSLIAHSFTTCTMLNCKKMIMIMHVLSIFAFWILSIYLDEKCL